MTVEITQRKVVDRGNASVTETVLAVGAQRDCVTGFQVLNVFGVVHTSVLHASKRITHWKTNGRDFCNT